MFNVWLAQNVPENERAEMTERYRAARGGQQTPVADEQRLPDDPNRARATAEAVGQVSDAQIAAFGAALFGTLDTQTLTGLAPSLASRVTWDQLPHDHRAVMTGMAIHALEQVIDPPPVDGEAAGATLWASALAHTGDLAALAGVVARRTPWTKLTRKDKLTVLQLAGETLHALPWPTPEGSTGSRPDQGTGEGAEGHEGD